MKLIAGLLCTVAGPDYGPRGGGQLPNPNECNSTLTSATRGIYAYPYMQVLDVDEREPSKVCVTAYVFPRAPLRS